MVTLMTYDPLTMSRILSTTKLANKMKFASWIRGFCRHCLILVFSEDQDPKSEISKIKFASWIRGFCRHLSDPCFVYSILDIDQVLIGLLGPIRSFFPGAEPFPIPAFMSIILSVPVVPFFGMNTFERTACWIWSHGHGGCNPFWYSKCSESM